MVRVQNIEASLPALEKAVLAQTSHIHLAYTAGMVILGYDPKLCGYWKFPFFDSEYVNFISESYCFNMNRFPSKTYLKISLDKESLLMLKNANYCCFTSSDISISMARVNKK